MKKFTFGKMVICLLAILISLSQMGICERAKIGIMPFKNKAGIDPKTADTLVDMLITAISKTNKFDIVERTALKDIADEQLLSMSGAVDENSAVKPGQIKAADYLIIGVITEAGEKKSNVAVMGISTGKSELVMAVDIRFIDTTTAQVKFAETFKKSKSDFLIAGKGSAYTISEGPMNELARDIIDEVTRKVMLTVYPPKIVLVSEKNVTLNYGSILFKKDEIWDVYELGEVIIDPDTKEKLGSSETKVGQITITETTEKMSKGTIISDAPEKIKVGNICRKNEPPKKEGKKKIKVPF